MGNRKLFVIEKSVFANSHKIFFFLLAGVDFIVGAIVGAQLGDSFLYDLFGSILPASIWAFLDSSAFIALTIVSAIMCFIVAAILILYVKTYKYEFYEDRIIEKYGLISRWEKQTPMTPIIGVYMEQSFWGRIFDYATITLEKIGSTKWSNFEMYRISEASAVKECLEEMISRTKGDIVSILNNETEVPVK